MPDEREVVGYMQPDIIRGRKNICQLLDVLSWRTVKRLIRLKGLPVVQEEGESPWIYRKHLAEWADRQAGKKIPPRIKPLGL